MKNELKEKLFLYSINELSEKERKEIENLLSEDLELKKEFDELINLGEAIGSNKPSPASDDELAIARRDLLRSIRTQEAEVSSFSRFVASLKGALFNRYGFAFTGATTLFIGIFVGYIFFSQQPINKQILTDSTSIDINKLQEEGDTEISNIRVNESTTKPDEIEIRFDAFKPISYKAKKKDPFVKQLLSEALLNSSNPGDRIRTVNKISTQVQSKGFNDDPKIKAALLKALKSDDNAAVRKEALYSLMQFPYDEEIRDGLLNTLSNDKNSGLRVAAINALADIKTKGISLDEVIRKTLNKKADQDDNDFVKIRSASLLKEL
ncbi:hypothetical protein APF79_12200 [bacterium BRH_c32]|nr:MAG: hypothetical protein APF79_12200 [bacterium BRH_c32]